MLTAINILLTVASLLQDRLPAVAPVAGHFSYRVIPATDTLPLPAPPPLPENDVEINLEVEPEIQTNKTAAETKDDAPASSNTTETKTEIDNKAPKEEVRPQENKSISPSDNTVPTPPSVPQAAQIVPPTVPAKTDHQEEDVILSPEPNAPEGTIIADPQIQSTVDLLAEVTKNPTPEKPASSPLLWHGSFMFSSEDIQRIEDAIRSATGATSASTENDTNNILADIAEQFSAPILTAPAYFLDSLLYISPNHWTIWLNGKRISHDDNTGQPHVLSINEHSVTLEWAAKSLDSLSTNWQEKLRPTMTEEEEIEETETKRFSNKDRTISYDKEEGLIRFILRPNQAFDVSNMEIVEGRQDAPQSAKDTEKETTDTTPSNKTSKKPSAAEMLGLKGTDVIPSLDAPRKPRTLEETYDAELKRIETLQKLGKVVQQGNQ